MAVSSDERSEMLKRAASAVADVMQILIVEASREVNPREFFCTALGSTIAMVQLHVGRDNVKHMMAGILDSILTDEKHEQKEANDVRQRAKSN